MFILYSFLILVLSFLSFVLYNNGGYPPPPFLILGSTTTTDRLLRRLVYGPVYIETQDKAYSMSRSRGDDQLFWASSGQVGAGPPSGALLPLLPREVGKDFVPVRGSKEYPFSDHNIANSYVIKQTSSRGINCLYRAWVSVLCGWDMSWTTRRPSHQSDSASAQPVTDRWKQNPCRRLNPNVAFAETACYFRMHFMYFTSALSNTV